MAHMAVREALKQLAKPEDLPLLREAFLRGSEDPADAVGALLRRGTREALDVLHAAVENGVFGFEVAQALAGTHDVPATTRVVVAWLEARPGAPEHNVAAAADLFDEIAAFDGAEALVPWTGSSEPQTVHRVGRALVRLGDARGVPMLIATVEGGRRGAFNVWQRADAARTLNEVTGKWHNVANESGSRDTSPEIERRFADAAADYRTWWEASKDRLVFDRATRRWSVR